MSKAKATNTYPILPRKNAPGQMTWRTSINGNPFPSEDTLMVQAIANFINNTNLTDIKSYYRIAGTNICRSPKGV
jgi:hypothetical protein